MAIIIVDTLTDVVDANDGVTSLREAIIQANSNADADTIVFDAALVAGDIQLTGELVLNNDVTINGDIDGDGSADIGLLAASSDRVFSISGPDTDAVLNGLTISGGYYSVESGGNIFASGINSLTITSSSILGGYAGLYGGNIFATDVNDVTIRDTTISGGNAYSGGGIAFDLYSGQSFTLSNSLVANNTASGGEFSFGGGIYLANISGLTTATIIGSTLTGNIAETGGGLLSFGNEISLHNSTVVGNEATFLGGGLNIDESDELVLTNSVIAENTSTNGLPTQNDIGGESDLTSTNSFFGSSVVITTDNGGNINNGGDAGLGALGDYGGAVETLLLESDSPLIGAGSIAALPADIYDLDGDGDTAESWSIDSTGNSRVVNTLDIGASEYTLSANVVVSTLADEDDGDYSFGDLSLREAINIVRDGGTITFDSSLAGGTIGLTQGLLSTPRDVTIDGDTNGDNAADITISGTNSSGILEFTAGTHSLESLVFLNGAAVDGGALFVGFGAEVTGSHLSFLSNFVSGDGGAVFNAGDLSLVNSTFANNGAGNNGGGIYNAGQLDLLQTTFVQNQALGSGGAIFAGGFESVSHSTLVQNIAGLGGAVRDFGPALSLTNSIVADNTGTVVDLDIDGSIIQLGGNIIGDTVYDGSSVIGMTTYAEIFGDNVLADNGGAVDTVALVSGSAAQSAGDLLFLPTDSYDVDEDGDTAELLPFDANGESRSDDGGLDLGAAEYIGPEFEGVLSDGAEALSFQETIQNGDLIFDVDANDGLGGTGEGNITYSLMGNTNGDGDSNMAFTISAAGVVTVNDVDDLNFSNSDGEFELFVMADNGAASNNTSAALLDITIIDLPETYTVTTLSDVVDANDGVMSLREAIAIAELGPAQDTIVFDSALSGGTITLAGSALEITRDIIIEGDIDDDGSADITIDADGLSRAVTITMATAELDGLNVTGGNALSGGGISLSFGSAATITNSSIYGNVSDIGAGIYNGGELNIFHTTIADNASTGDGGGLRSEGFLTLNTVTLSGNSAGDDGGAIFAAETTGFNLVNLTNVTISGNSASDDGGGIYLTDATLTVNNSTFTGNYAGDRGGAARFIDSSEQLNNSIVAGNNSGGSNNNIAGNYASANTLVTSDAANVFASLDTNGGGLLGDNGGTVQTAALLINGLARNAGDAALLPNDQQDLDGDLDTAEALSLDANGNARVLGTLDLGAVEYFGPELEGVLTDGAEDFTLSELTAASTVLIDVDANDGLGGATDVGMTYSILSGNIGGAFAIDSASGVITLADAAAIDAETGTLNFNIVVQADNGAASNNVATATLNVDITDIAETLVVTTISDVVDANDGLLSLREAVNGANNGDAQETITFDAGLAGGTLTLSSVLTLTEDIIIDGDVNGDNRADITLSGNGSQSLFALTGANTDAQLLSLALVNADGAVSASDASSLFIMDSTLSGSDTSGNAGAVSSVNTDTVIVNSLITENDGGLAGGVYSNGGNLMLINSFVVGNNAAAGTGGVNIAAGSATLVNTTLTENTGSTAGGLDGGANSVSFVNTAISGNTGGSGNADAQGSDIIATNSFFGVSIAINFDNGGNINGGGDAGLTALFDRGATTLTLGHSSTSALVDAGSNAALPNDIYDLDADGNTAEDLPVDARGARIQNGTVDIGAAEQAEGQSITATNSGELIIGSSAGETINALAGNDNLFAGSGNDTVYGGDGDDYLRGDAGDDMLFGGFGVDFLRGGAGADALFGGAGQDWADYSPSRQGVTVNLATGIGLGGDAEGDTYSLVERVLGSTKNDNITGDSGVNYLRGFGGDDVLSGGGGVDYLQGDAGADALDGGAGGDFAYYASSSVGLTVNLGNPSLNTGEAIGDTYVNIENLFGSRFNDDLTGDSNNNFVRGLQGDDDLYGGTGDDFLRGDQGADFHDGGAGNDWLYYATSSSGVTIDLAAGTASGGDAAGDTFTSIERVYGSNLADDITGDSGVNYLRGSGGSDVINGSAGNDFLQGDSGADTLDGGAGSDWAYYFSSKTALVLNLGNAALNTGEAAGDSYISIENILGTRFDDDITGDSGNNTLRGFNGDDILNGGAGDDVLRGEAGADTFVFEVGGDNDVVIDWADADDFLDLTDFGFANTAAAMATATQVGSDVVFTIGSDSITIEDTTTADIMDNLIL